MGTSATIYIKNEDSLVKIYKQYDGNMGDEILTFIRSKTFVKGFTNNMQFNGVDDFSSQFVTYLKLRHSGGVLPGNTYLCGVDKFDFEFIETLDLDLLDYTDFVFIIDFDNNILKSITEEINIEIFPQNEEIKKLSII